MTTSKNTKRALLSSVLAMVLCIAMLVGTTFAWFTDRVTSGNNKIVAGNLDVELYHGANLDEPVNGATDLFTQADGTAITWEPGAIAYENFKVENAGSLALKYQLSMNIKDYNTVDGKSLADVLKVAVLEGETFTGDRAAAQGLTFDETLSDFVKEGNLTAGTENTYAVVIYWEPGANDNDYNLNNGKTSSDGNPLFIDLGITLVAAQDTVESDSFDSDYDAAAEYPIVVSSADELTDAVENAQAGDVVQLSEDITVEEPLAITAPDVTIDGNGKTITGTVAAETSFISVNTDGDFTMTNLTIAPTGTVTPNAAINLNVDGKIVVTNCVFGDPNGTADVMYNGLEFSGSKAIADGSVISGNIFYGNSFRHNCISAYVFEDGATVTISNNKFIDLNSNTSNAIRLSNYTGANVTVNMSDNEYSIVKEGADTQWAGFLLFQKVREGGKNMTVNITNLTVNGVKATSDNKTGTVDQIAVLYMVTPDTMPTIYVDGAVLTPYIYQ